MSFESLVHGRDHHPIPLSQIADSRTRFGHRRIYFEIDLETDDAWRGLGAAAQAFARSGLEPVSLRLLRNGRISGRLSDSLTADLAGLCDGLSRVSSLRIVGWTTVIAATSNMPEAT